MVGVKRTKYGPQGLSATFVPYSVFITRGGSSFALVTVNWCCIHRFIPRSAFINITNFQTNY